MARAYTDMEINGKQDPLLFSRIKQWNMEICQVTGTMQLFPQFLTKEPENYCPVKFNIHNLRINGIFCQRSKPHNDKKVGLQQLNCSGTLTCALK